jgi:hypothetical protein
MAKRLIWRHNYSGGAIMAVRLIWRHKLIRRRNYGGSVNLAAQLFRQCNYAVRSNRKAAQITKANIKLPENVRTE